MVFTFFGLLLIFAVGLLISWIIVTQPLLVSPRPNAPTVSVPPVRLERHVGMVSQTYLPRHAAHPENLDRIAAYIAQEFAQANARVVEQPYAIDGHTYRNVIGSYGPDTADRIVIGAHYDAAGPFPGADDNASGVAGLLELAYLLGTVPLSTRVELVAYTLEEPPYFRTPLMGSAVHAQSLRQQGHSVRVMIALEMIGYFSDAPNSQLFPASILKLFYPTEGNFIAIVGNVGQGAVVRRAKRAMRGGSALPVYSLNAPRFVPGVDFSDHLNYWAAGYQALMITDTAFYRNARYHTAHDTPDTLDYTRMAMVVQGVYAAVLAFAHETR
jgi:Zn-dependent M28 family amino/carboxypeptidase